MNTLLICTVLALTQSKPTLRRVTADWEDYALELATVALAIIVAWALADWPAAITIVFGITLVLHGKVLLPQLRDAARTDAKTGLLNHTAWSTSAKQELDRSTRNGQPVGVLMVDLDHFKLVNDVYGHLFGDEVLIHIAITISGELRRDDLIGRSDLVGRFGGEEFVALLPGASDTAAFRVAERIRQQIAGLAIPTDDSIVNVTASIGVAASPTNGSTLDTLLAAADRAVYTAKTAGRNQVHLSPSHTN